MLTRGTVWPPISPGVKAARTRGRSASRRKKSVLGRRRRMGLARRFEALARRAEAVECVAQLGLDRRRLLDRGVKQALEGRWLGLRGVLGLLERFRDAQADAAGVILGLGEECELLLGGADQELAPVGGFQQMNRGAALAAGRREVRRLDHLERAGRAGELAGAGHEVLEATRAGDD